MSARLCEYSGCGALLPRPLVDAIGRRRGKRKRFCDATCARRHRDGHKPRYLFTADDRRRGAIAGARSRRIGILQGLAARFIHLDRDEALRAAFLLGKQQGYAASARDRSTRKGVAA